MIIRIKKNGVIFVFRKINYRNNLITAEDALGLVNIV